MDQNRVRLVFRLRPTAGDYTLHKLPCRPPPLPSANSSSLDPFGVLFSEVRRQWYEDRTFRPLELKVCPSVIPAGWHWYKSLARTTKTNCNSVQSAAFNFCSTWLACVVITSKLDLSACVAFGDTRHPPLVCVAESVYAARSFS